MSEYLKTLLGDEFKDGLTVEELSDLLEKRSTDQKKELDKLKASVSKANSEAADWKKKFRDQQSDEQRKADESKELLDRLQKENEALKKAQDLSAKTASYLKLGYPQELASSTASALLEGDFDTVFKNQETFLASVKKETLQQGLQNTPRPQITQTGTVPTDYSKMISEALTNGRPSEAAYYTRLQQMELNQQK